MASPPHENDEERPQSIAALRSKFESLAVAGVNSAPTDVPSASNGHATVSSTRNGLLTPRPETPVDGQNAKVSIFTSCSHLYSLCTAGTTTKTGFTSRKPCVCIASPEACVSASASCTSSSS